MRHVSILALLLLFATPAHAEEAPQAWLNGNLSRNTVVIKLGEHFAVEYERAVHPKVSVFVGPAMFAAYNRVGNVTNTELGFGGTVGARFFVAGLAPEGLFVGPLLTIGYSNMTNAGISSHGLRITSGAMVGYTWIFGDVFDLSLGAGANYVNASTTLAGGSAPSPVEASLRAAIGVAF